MQFVMYKNLYKKAFFDTKQIHTAPRTGYSLIIDPNHIFTPVMLILRTYITAKNMNGFHQFFTLKYIFLNTTKFFNTVQKC